jgi:hypothetical protein
VFICHHGSLSTELESWRILPNNSFEVVEKGYVEQQFGKCNDVDHKIKLEVFMFWFLAVLEFVVGASCLQSAA